MSSKRIVSRINRVVNSDFVHMRITKFDRYHKCDEMAENGKSESIALIKDELFTYDHNSRMNLRGKFLKFGNILLFKIINI